jgi:hypothetical protein
LRNWEAYADFDSLLVFQITFVKAPSRRTAEQIGDRPHFHCDRTVQRPFPPLKISGFFYFGRFCERIPAQARLSIGAEHCPAFACLQDSRRGQDIPCKRSFLSLPRRSRDEESVLLGYLDNRVSLRCPFIYDDYLVSSCSSHKLLKRNGRSSEAGFEDPGQEVVFHGSSVEPVVQFADIAIQALCLDLVVGSEQEALQVRERDVDPGKQRVGRFLLT